MPDRSAAQEIHQAGVDILLDLKGFTRNARPGILAHRPAPVQINWLGFPATSGCDFLDYVLADSIVIPHGQEQHWSEAVLRLPHCYQPNDRKRPRPTEAPSRQSLGLPEEAVVLAAFNQINKLTPEVFEIWTRLMTAAPEAVLWLQTNRSDVMETLRREAEARGIAASRLVQAQDLPLAEHLARYHVADLFLDTYPCVAHTTASDALWMGCPIITCAGSTFASRVAASVANAAGMPSLAVHDLAEYERNASLLTTDRTARERLRQHLKANVAASPLFDSPRFTRHLETAYKAVHDRRLSGLAPTSFDIPE